MRSFLALVFFTACSTVLHATPIGADAHQDLDTVGPYVVTFERPGLVETVSAVPHRAKTAGATGRTLDVSSKSAWDVRAKLATERDLLLADAARRLGREVEPLHVYDLALNGVALEMSREEALALAAMPGIARVEPERVLRLQTDRSAAFLGATAVWNAPLPFGSRGAGAVVGIIDSGLNRQHPSFAAVSPADGYVHSNPKAKFHGLCVAAPSKCNAKVIGIYDYTDEGLVDGIDQSNHGSLVAGIAVGNAVDVPVSGVSTRISGIAPRASLIVYKTCISDTNGSCTVGDIIAALEQAIVDGVDAVNLSLGYAPNDPWICLGSTCTGPEWDALAEVMLNVHAAGIVGVVAAGNAGPIPRTVLAPGSSPWVITVASARHDRFAPQANQLAESSSRGPGLVEGYLVPDVTAPGVEIRGASVSGAGTVVGFGTSMAAPQVAGAAALLAAAHPEWTVADISSALVTTARPVITLPGGVTPAGLFDQGAGLIDLSQATSAGLSLRIDANAYRAANPHTGGSVAAMNEPALILDECFRTCTVTRTFTALASGSWNVVPEVAAGVSISASPATFTLAAGQTREVSFSVNAEARAGEWIYGAVRLKRTDAIAPDTRLPLAVFADPGPVPAEIVVQASSDAGFTDVIVPGLVALPDATFAASAPGEVFTRSEPLPKGPTANPFNANAGGADGAFAQFVTIPAFSGDVTLKIETLDSPAVEVQLYAGRDVNLDGKTQQTETECASTQPGDRELCELVIPNASIERRYWFVANNREASTPGATDLVTVRWVVLRSAPSDVVTVTGPGHVDSGEPFSIRVSWKDFTLTPGAERESVLRIGTKPDRPGDIGAIPVKLKRGGDATTAAAALVPGEALTIRLQPGEAEDRLYVDVPPNASALSVKLVGSGEVDVYAARMAEPVEPAIAPAPARNVAAAHTSAAGANDTLVVDGTQLAPGRWYLSPVNNGTQRADFTITPTLSYGSARAEPRAGAYFNPARAGAGGFFYRAGSTWAYIWYTYLEDGTPTWYLGANAAPGAQEGTWVVPLDRYTWDGAQANGTRIGEGILTLVSPTQFRFAWNIDGQSGSESYQFIDGGGCPPGVTTNVTGSWFAPELPGYGFSVSMYTAVSGIAAYFYDDSGIARWAIGADNAALSGSMVMSQYRGAAPLASYEAPVTEAIGTFARTFTQSAGNGHLDLQLEAPLTGEWDTAHALQRLTDSLGCE